MQRDDAYEALHSFENAERIWLETGGHDIYPCRNYDSVRSDAH